MSLAAANDPTAPLWQTLRDFIAQAFSLFGAPHEIAQQSVRLREEHSLFLRYLRQCETLLRKLLFIDALALSGGDTHAHAGTGKAEQSPGHACVSPPRTRRFHEQDPDNSEQWRVTFRLIGDTHALRGPRKQCPAESLACVSPIKNSAARFTSTWPAAERFEALLRAFNDPAPYVKRLARLIQRNARAIRSYFLHVPERSYGQSVLEEPIRDATRLARQRCKEPDSS